MPWADRQANGRQIGVVFGQRTQLYWDLPLIESFQLLRAIYDVPKATYERNLKEFRDLLGLDEFINTPVRQLSLGQRMRGDFAAAMLHEPKIVFLDEPTIGLDVVAKENIRQFILRVNRERGTTVILTTHDLADIEKAVRAHHPHRPRAHALRRQRRDDQAALRPQPHAHRGAQLRRLLGFPADDEGRDGHRA